MEYVAGTSLEQRIKSGGPLETEQIVRIAVQIAAGLAAAHRNGLVHRDVKPANILLEQGTNLVKITDFGLARAVDDEGITQAGVVAGTPEYMAPEQAQGGAVDQRADLFSLGSVMYAMCTGRSPFRAEGSLARLRRVIDDAPQSIHEINPAIPSWLVEIVDRLHVKDPAERFQTAAEVADVLETRLTQLQAGELPTAKAVSVSRGLCWRRPLAWTAAICASLLLGLVVSETAGVTHLASTVIRVAAGEGTLVIEVDDPSIRVDIPGEEVVITGAGLHEIRLRPGEYRVRSTSEGKPIRDDLITISRGEQRVLAVRLETPAELFAADLSSEAATAPPPTATTAAELREANLRERIARNPDDSGSHYALAFILQNRGEYAEAEAEYRKVQQLAPDSMTTQVARVLVQQHKLDEAEAELRAYLGRHPENAGGHYYLGLLLSERKKYDEAESAFRRVLELQPGSAPILHQLALAVRNQGRRDEADEILHSIQNPAASQRPPDSENNPGWSIGN
jgi:TolA-binding protein